MDKSARGWEICAVVFPMRRLRAPHIEHNRAGTRHGARLEQARQLARVIDMQVSEQNDVDIGERNPGFTEPGKCPRAGIDEYSRSPVDEQEIARCRATRGSGSP